MAHSDIIKQAAVNVGSLSTEAQAKITPDLLSMAMKEMLTVLGDIGFDEYVGLFSGPSGSFNRNEEFYILTEDERKIKKLELAEAYFLLYFLAPSLKELEENVAISPKMKFGTGEIIGSPIQDIIRMREQYYQSAIRIIQEVLDSSGMFLCGSV